MILLKHLYSHLIYRRLVTVYVTLLTITANTGSNYITLPTKLNLLRRFSDVTNTVVEDSLLPRCSLTYVKERSTPSDFLLELLRNLKTDTNVGVFQSSLLELKDTMTPVNLYHHINKIRQTSRCIIMIVSSDDTEFLETIVKTAVEEGLLIWPTRLVLITRRSLSDLQNLQEPLSFINAVVVIMHQSSKSLRYIAYAFLPYSSSMIRVATWNSHSSHASSNGLELFPDKFRRIKADVTMRVVANNFPQHVMIKKTRTAAGEEKVTFSGPLVFVLKMLAKKMNFTYDLIHPTDGSWGNRFPNGSWNGMIGMMIRKEIDFGLGPFGVTYMRWQHIDYTNPLVLDYGRILGRRGDTEVDPWGFVLPLTPSVWAGTFLSLFVILVISKLASRIGSYPRSPFSKISNATYIRAFLQQNIDVAYDSGWEKVLLGFWLLGILILLECYSTNLMSLLAVRYISEPYQSVRELLDDSTVTLMWAANTAYTQYLAAVESGIFQEVMESEKRGRLKFVPAPQYVANVEEFVTKGDHVFITPFINMKLFLTEDYMEKGNCMFYVSRETFLPQTFCMAVPKNSPLRGPINEGIRAVVEGGLYGYWLDNTLPNARSCKNPPRKITVKAALSVINLWGVFVVLLTGYVMSFFVFLLEIVRKKLP